LIGAKVKLVHYDLPPGPGWDVAALEGVASKWAVLIVVSLAKGGLRFGEIKRAVEGIPQKALASTLRTLERDGLIKRTLHSRSLARSHYELTAIGRHALIPLRALVDWADQSREAVAAARAAFDQFRSRTG
jgi:DNA-binding HxlR family transcriptional regulator